MPTLTQETLFNDLIEKVYRRVMGGVRERVVTINQSGGLTSTTATTLQLSGPQIGGIAPGVILACELENLYINTWNPQTEIATVVRGYGGSPAATHANGTLCYLNPRYTRYDIAVAINDDLRSLSAEGLYRVGVAQITYNPVYMGYDLGDVPANFIDVLGIRFKTPTPYRNFPALPNYYVDRHNPDSVFPSGMGITIYDGAWPGLPMYVTYSAPFLPLLNTTDDVTNTPVANDPAPPNNGYTVSTVSNLANTMIDIPPLGAAISLTLPGEIGRNRMESQPDPRKAAEVPDGAVMNSVAGLITQRTTRIQEEADRLLQQLYFVRGW